MNTTISAGDAVIVLILDAEDQGFDYRVIRADATLADLQGAAAELREDNEQFPYADFYAYSAVIPAWALRRQDEWVHMEVAYERGSAVWPLPSNLE